MERETRSDGSVCHIVCHIVRQMDRTVVVSLTSTKKGAQGLMASSPPAAPEPRAHAKLPGRTSVVWPFVAATVVAVIVIAYLADWGRRYGLDLHVYRDSVSDWNAGHDPYFSSFTRYGSRPPTPRSPYRPSPS